MYVWTLFVLMQIANAIIRITKQIEEAFSDHPESVVMVLPFHA